MNPNDLADASVLNFDESDALLDPKPHSAALFAYLFVAISGSVVGLITGWLLWAH
jgi:hypothetical protein